MGVAGDSFRFTYYPYTTITGKHNKDVSLMKPSVAWRLVPEKHFIICWVSGGEALNDVA